jgi:hypothetical protein
MEKKKYQNQIIISKLFLYRTIKNCNKNAEEVILSFAKSDEQKILLMGIKRFTKGYNINPKELRRKIANKIIDENQYVRVRFYESIKSGRNYRLTS